MLIQVLIAMDLTMVIGSRVLPVMIFVLESAAALVELRKRFVSTFLRVRDDRGWMICYKRATRGKD